MQSESSSYLCQEPLPFLYDADLLDFSIRSQLSQHARNLFRNLTLALLRRGHYHLYVSDQYAACMAKCEMGDLPSVRSELIRHGLLQLRPTKRFPRYQLVQQPGQQAIKPKDNSHQ